MHVRIISIYAPIDMHIYIYIYNNTYVFFLSIYTPTVLSAPLVPVADSSRIRRLKAGGAPRARGGGCRAGDPRPRLAGSRRGGGNWSPVVGEGAGGMRRAGPKMETQEGG